MNAAALADHKLREAAEAWAVAYRRRQAAASTKRKVADAVRGKLFRERFIGDALGHEFAASAQLDAARAELRAATKTLLDVVDPKPLTLRGKAREVQTSPGTYLLPPIN